MLKLSENNSNLSDLFWSNILSRALDETRAGVAEALFREFHSDSYLVHVGGHHVALIDNSTGKRVVLITGTSPDFSDHKPQDEGAAKAIHPRVFKSRSVVNDLNLMRKLCEMISCSREIIILTCTYQGHLMSDDPVQWTAKVDPRRGSRYAYILLGNKRHLAVEHETGKIFKVFYKSQQVNRKDQFGTLDTLDNWNWGWSVPRERVRY